MQRTESESDKNKWKAGKEAFEEKVEGEWEGRRDVGKEKRKMPPFQPSYSLNGMLTAEKSNRSKCMKPELVNCSLCGSCAIQHPSPV